MKDKSCRDKTTALSEKLDAVIRQNQRLLDGLEATKAYTEAVEQQVAAVARFVGMKTGENNDN